MNAIIITIVTEMTPEIVEDMVYYFYHLELPPKS
jgi:hypothetical protein